MTPAEQAVLVLVVAVVVDGLVACGRARAARAALAARRGPWGKLLWRWAGGWRRDGPALAALAQVYHDRARQQDRTNRGDG